MAKATGAQTSIAYVAETVWGTTPASPTMNELRVKAESIDLAKGLLRSEEIKSHRQVQNVIHGMHAVQGQLECEFGDFLDSFLEAALFGEFVSNVLKLGQTQKFFTLERRLHSLHRSMQYTGVMLNGLNLVLEPEAIAQIAFPVMGKTMVTAVDALAAPSGWLVNEPVTPPAVNDLSFDIDTGTTDPAVDDTFMVYQTGAVDTPRSDQIYTVTAYSAPLLSFTPPLDIALVDNDILHFIRPATTITTNDPFDSFSGTITEGGSSIAIVTGLTLDVVQGIEPALAIGSNLPNELIEGGVAVTGTLRVYVEDFVLFNKWLNENYSTLQFVLTDGSTTYTWLLPRVKYTGGIIQKPAGGTPIIQELPFEAVYDTTEATSVKITKS